MTGPSLHEVVCRTQHPAEWDAPEPRRTPCDQCLPVVAAVRQWIDGRLGDIYTGARHGVAVAEAVNTAARAGARS